MPNYEVYFTLKENVKNKLRKKGNKVDPYHKITKRVSGRTKASAKNNAYSDLSKTQKKNYKYNGSVRTY